VAIGGIVLACLVGGTLLGIALRDILPAHHLNTESRDLVRLGMGLIATMSALVLGLLIASAKGSYEAQAHELTHLATNVIVLDRVMAHYGPETKGVRGLLRRAVVDAVARMWPEHGSRSAQLEPTPRSETIYDQIQKLSPHNDAQRALQARALAICIDLARTRWLLVEQSDSSVPVPFLITLVFWLTILFASFGLFAPRNVTVIATLLVCALSASSAVFLILQLDRPFGGLIQISNAPLRNALQHLGQ
jgi:hypothetical protein